MTALMVAAELGYTEIVELLLANGASVHTVCKVQNQTNNYAFSCFYVSHVTNYCKQLHRRDIGR